MSSQPPNAETPTTGPHTAELVERTAPPAGSTPADQTPPASAVDAQRLTEAEQRASEQRDRAEQVQAALDSVQQALAPNGGETAGDPAQLATVVAERDKQLAELGEQLRTAQVELAAHREAGEYGARADRLLNSRSFLDSVAGLDPSGPKFAQQLGEQIRAAVEADPDLYRAAALGRPRAGRSSTGRRPPASRPELTTQA